MTIGEKREFVRDFCRGKSCETCPLREISGDQIVTCPNGSDGMILILFERLTTLVTAPVNTCVSCGAEIPEGRLVCPDCEEYTCETCAFEDCSPAKEPCFSCKNNMEWTDPQYDSTPCNWKPGGYTEPDPIETNRPANMQVMSYEEHKENTLEKVRESIVPDPIKPEYYNDTKITPFDVIDDWGLNFYLGNAVKYIKRAGKKAGNSKLQDLKKIREYIDHEIRAEEVN